MKQIIKKRFTKFAKSSETSEISCKDEESLCGVLSDYDESGERLYAFQCCENANTQSDEANTEEKTETVNLKEGESHICKASRATRVIKSFKIVSISESSITYSITYCKFKRSTTRFTESTTVKEYSSSSSSSSSKSSWSKGGEEESKGNHEGKSKQGKGSKDDKGGKSKGGKGKGGKN